MTNKFRSIMVALVVTVNGFTVSSQPVAKPEIGKAFPYFTFNNVEDFKKTKVSASDFRGKWLIMDFWTLTCRSCLTAFPKIKQIQSEFPERLQFLLVGRNDRRFNINIEKIYKTISRNMRMKIAHTYDTVLVDRWEVQGYPQLYIIDPDGILRHITDGRDLSSEKIEGMINGQAVQFYPELTYDNMPPFEINRLTQTDKIMYTSIITKAHGERQSFGFDLARYVKARKEVVEAGWSVANVPLYVIYNHAYFGKDWWGRYDTAYYGKVNLYPILKVQDTSRFQFDYSVYPAKGTYNCYLKMPLEDISVSNMMSELQRLLEKAFGYKASVEMREMPVWRLVSEQSAGKKLRTDGGARYMTPGSAAGGFVLRNQSMAEFMRLLTAHLPNKEQRPFFDNTGITHKIDISIEADMTDYEDVQKKLAKYGLSLQLGTKKMKVLVIRDLEQ